MSGRIAQEIKQKKPMPLEVEALLNIQRTADYLGRGIAELLKSQDLSHTQYNVLRILRGAGDKGLPCGEIAARMVTRDPDITRLIDRMVERGLVSRIRGEKDRRVVTVKIVDKGLRMTEMLDAPLLDFQRRQFAALNQQQLRNLIGLLESVRGSADA